MYPITLSICICIFSFLLKCFITKFIVIGQASKAIAFLCIDDVNNKQRRAILIITNDVHKRANGA